MRIGLIVNPIAGMGGRVALKGTDGPDAAVRAAALGAAPVAQERAGRFLMRLATAGGRVEVLTVPGAMGADAMRAAGFPAEVLSVETGVPTLAGDTRRAVQAMEAAGVDLIVFAGGDGTARDVLDAMGTQVPVLGIPSGVKMHSAVFATSPEAGAVLVAALASPTSRFAFHHAEVMDVDERLLTEGAIVAKLYGYLRVPVERRLVQAGKARGVSASAQLAGAAREIAASMVSGTIHLIGPGTSMGMVKRALGFEGTLLGVDAVLDGQVAGLDLTEQQILDLAADRKLHIVVGLVGGQGFVLGRGNQQISPDVVRRAGGRDGLTILASTEKLLALDGAPLLVDTGDATLDAALAGYVRVATGPGETAIMRIAAPPDLMRD